ncbi:MAG: CPBP family intramembrane metalloprotease [Bacteroidales bacterium]|nr:CPBP family intramembrane metalloprotease [Bacteroidales bacterium]
MKNVKLYIAIAYGLIWGAGLVFYLSGTNVASFAGATQLLASFCMFIPLVATLICQKSSKEPLLRNVGISWKVNRWWFFGWLIVPLIPLLTILFTHWTIGLSFNVPGETVPLGFMNKPVGMVGITLLSGMVAGVTINALFAFGEEIGWRGYLLKQFEGKNFLTTSIIIGIIWGLWHAPLILLGHNYPQHPQWGVLMMVVLSIPLSFIIQYFRVKSGSVIVAAVMHGTFNALAGMAYIFIDMNNWNDLINASCGLTGICSLLVVAIAIFLFDRYITREHLVTRPISIPNTTPHEK